MPNKDFFHMLEVPGVALAHGTFTADVTNATVTDLDEHGPGAVVGFLVIMYAQTTVNASNYFDLKVFDADAKTSSTALDATSAEASNVGREGHDVLGVTEDGTLLDATSMSTFPLPRFNDSAQVGKVYFVQYRGYKPKVQPQLDATGSPDASFVILRLVVDGDTKNIKAPVVN